MTSNEHDGAGPARAAVDRVGAIARTLAIFGGALMLVTAVMVTLSVGGRWALRSAIPGDFELVQIATAVAVFSFLPLCQLGRGNVFVDTFTLRAPDWFNRSLDMLWDLVYAGFAWLIAWRLALGAYDAISSKTSSMVLAFPIGWAIAACAVMAAFLGLVTLLTMMKLGRGGR
ncbi:TRAP transporter small permease [Phreatobacter aquaticus]|uniref:TRAP transporter small permease protein n=1 Tax=Phreatobacter aquaticus TaxID=2570229 RepID=A0A4D7QJM9_9HYPH|nr:TRAP transporter small permease subunit [Phreatobacter aquaticus]QCK87295.1 TRAP transporter small permease [Phreatobacter aquaticus]